jgi:NADH-quinone oxidoreductase subunit C
VGIALPSNTDLKAFSEKLKEQLGDLITKVEIHKGFILVEAPLDKFKEAAKRLKEMGFDHVKSVTVVDRIKEGVFEVGYHVSSYLNEELAKYIVELVTNIPRDNPRVPSLVDIWLSAEFQEREAHEGFGIIFEGHPDLRPILLAPTVAELRPMRKEFVVKEEGIYRELPKREASSQKSEEKR